MKRRNIKETDYTLAYLRFLAGFRSSPPSAYSYGLSPEAAQEKRTMVQNCLNQGIVNTVGTDQHRTERNK
jgi:hypothetical protein